MMALAAVLLPPMNGGNPPFTQREAPEDVGGGNPYPSRQGFQVIAR